MEVGSTVNSTGANTAVIATNNSKNPPTATLEFEIRKAGQVVRPFSFGRIAGCVSGFEVKIGSLDQEQRIEDQ
tara:strand:+ start:436 stop:654 length:219 start_codon:yes stop_codon:yes gene_type:complete